MFKDTNSHLDLHVFLDTIFSKYLTSTNRKYNRVGLLLLKSLLVFDIQELNLSSHDLYQINSPDSYNVGESVLYRELKQSDHSESIRFDGCHCLLDAYFKDIQQVCLVFYEHEDIIVRVVPSCMVVTRTVAVKYSLSYMILCCTTLIM